MEKIIIYGAGNTGKGAFYSLRNKYECFCFVDSDENKWGKYIEGIEIYSPSILAEVQNIKVIIASIFWKEIYNSINKYETLDIAVYSTNLNFTLPISITDQLNTRTIDLGQLFFQHGDIKCKEMTFMLGGSGILDYAFIKLLAEKYNCKTYLEIGTYIGESINVLTDCCEKLYSITAGSDNPYSMKFWCMNNNIPDYSDKLAYDKKIKHYYSDSKLFDFSKIEDSIDLFFIDGDHSYNGVYADTKNIFNIVNEKSIIVWHDFRSNYYQYNCDVVRAVKDALGKKFENVYVTNRNMCGVYLPKEYSKDVVCKELKYEENLKLFTADVLLNNYKFIE